MTSSKPHILFVCTGNIFRSMSAEWVSRAIAERLGAGYVFSSAGTDGGVPRDVRDIVKEVLLANGVDVTAHRHRLLTQELIDTCDLVVAMSTDHKDFIFEKFGHVAVLFRELAEGVPEAVLDVNEAVLDYETNIDAANRHITETIEFIAARCGPMFERLPSYLK